MGFFGGGGGGGGGAETVLDLDFSAEANQTLATNTTYTIAGKTWTKINSANDNVAMAITNGSGLVIQPKAATDYAGVTRSLPAITLPLASISPEIGLGSSLRVWMYISADNMAGQYDLGVVAVDSASFDAGYIAKRGYGVSGQGVGAHFQHTSGTNPGFNEEPVTLAAGNRVLVLDIPRLGSPMVEAKYGAWSSGWPAASALKPARQRYGTVEIFSQLTMANAVLLIGAQRSGSGTSLSVTINRVRVDVG